MKPTTLFGALRGPLMLITLGALLAMDQMEQLSFASTWPTLLILYGALKLAERAFRPSSEEGPGSNSGSNYGQGGSLA